MSDSASGSSAPNTFVATNVCNGSRKSTGRLITSGHRSLVRQSLGHLPSRDHWIIPGKLGSLAAGPVTSFLIEVAALELVRRFSKAKCPLVWSTLQALQIVCYPPFRLIQRWNPFRALVRGMQVLSRPLLVISIATAVSDRAGCSDTHSDSEGPPHTGESNALECQPDLSSVQPVPDMRSETEATQSQSSKSWLLQFYEELERRGITLPERFNEDELNRYYASANGDFSYCLSLVKKTLSWRETYRFLSAQELEIWSNMVFWHGYDLNGRLCLVVRLGLACMTVPSCDRPRFAQAIVSQVEYGVLHLMDRERCQITVLVDCEGLRPLKFPMKISLTCSNYLQEHFPKRLGCVYVIRLPPIARVIAQTFIHFLRPGTRAKLRVLGDNYKEVLSELIELLPSSLGGLCTCMKCSGEDMCDVQESRDSDSTESVGIVTRDDFLLPALDEIEDSERLAAGISEQSLRKAVIGVLIFWVLIAFIAGIYDPESSPF